jgi:homoserine O-acetyltransferase
MRRMMVAALGFALVAKTATATAQIVPADTGSFVMRDFRFASGEVLPELRIHYRTLGHPRTRPGGQTRNAVLILHGTGGSGQGFLSRTYGGELFGPGQPLDTAEYFVIIPDNLGHGRSSKPSDGLHAHFPHYAYEDMVTAQHRLLTEGLHVNHLALLMGTSMGCMHSWLWLERWPSFMDGAVPLACLPTQIAGRNRMWRKLTIDAIRNSPDYANGDYTTQPSGLLPAVYFLWFVGTAPLNELRLGPTRDSADTWITTWVRTRLATTDANDFVYAVDASRDYDPSEGLERITAPVLAINSADDEINPPELGIMERLMPRVRHGRYVLLPISTATRGHGTHSLPAVWGNYLVNFLAEIRGERNE